MKNRLNFNEFQRVGFTDWKRVANRELKGEEASERLQWQVDQDLALGAYYDHESVRYQGYISTFFSMLPERPWMLVEEIIVKDVKQANKDALTALNGGCDGLIFHISEDAYLSALTKDILFKHCKVSFVLSDSSLSNEVASYMRANKIDGFVISDINLGNHTTGNFIDQLFDQTSWYQENGNSFFYLEMGHDFFHEIAKIRALRYLVYQLSKFQDHEITRESIHIHVRPISLLILMNIFLPKFPLALQAL